LSSVAIAPFLLGLAIWMAAPGSSGPPAQTAARPASPPPSRSAAGATFEALSKQANAAREAGRLEEAIALYRDALRLKPEWTEGRWYLGTSYYELDRYELASAAFKRVIASEPKHGPAWGFRGLCEFQLRQYEPALVSLMKAREIGLGANQELASVVRYHTAILLTRFSQFDFAQKVLSEFTADGNDNPKILEALGLATLRVPQLPEELDPAA
jgi:tetratricopeptide (TPR) repeat protein